MDTFEFLSILQIHGFPRLLGVATHMDHIKDNKQKKKLKKELRLRFDIEIPSESKLFFIKGMKNGLYDFRDIHNLTRFISVIIPRALPFKQEHSHMLIDRFEKINNGNSSSDDSDDLFVFGYVRGTNLVKDLTHKKLLLSGLGLVDYEEISEVNDPCPLVYQKNEGKDEQLKKIRERALREHEKMIYAPQCNIGLTLYDETGDYINIPDKHVVFTKRDDAEQDNFANHVGVKMIREMHETSQGILAETDNRAISEEEQEQNDPSDNDSEDEDDLELIEGVQLEESNIIEEEDPHEVAPMDQREIGDLAYKIHEEYKSEDEESSLKKNALDLNTLVYGENSNDNKTVSFSNSKRWYLNDHEDTPSQGVKKGIQFILHEDQLLQSGDNSYFYSNDLMSPDFYQEHTKKRFVTGFDQNDSDNDGEDDDEENLEDDKSEQDSSVDFEDYDSDNEEQKEIEQNIEIEKMKNENSEIISKGKYVRIHIKCIKKTIFEKFDESPIILSQLTNGETQMGFLLVKFKRHRFYRNLLKTNDPLIVSLNFSKYQTIPYFCRKDVGDRLRMLKYTPKHEFCTLVFFGPYVPAHTGVVAFQTLNQDEDKFRVSGTGVVIGFSNNYDIKKKLRLVGEPFKIMKNTALVKNMFSSDLEVSKFMNAQIKTVSGIRGQIKKSSGKMGPAGSFRATFEDKIQMSDLVFCRTWYTMKLTKFCNPISKSFLL
jgi:ribosome biogenesis protein BMS1